MKNVTKIGQRQSRLWYFLTPLLALSILALTFAPRSAEAIIVIHADQVGPDVIFSWGGAGTTPLIPSVNLDSLPTDPGGITFSEAKVGSLLGEFTSGALGGGAVTSEAFGGPGTVTKVPFGTGGVTLSAVFTGGDTSFFSMTFDGVLDFNTGFVSNVTPITAGTATFLGESFASLGIDTTAGDHPVATWADDSIVIRFFNEGVAVPEPSRAILVSLAAGAFLIRRKRKV